MSDQTPLVPADVDLRDFPFMPLDIKRLLTSETWIEASVEPKLGHALICLWCESWHQVPASSLPDNDLVLSRLAMCTLGEWREIKERALSGWVLCADGGYYHPVVAEKALEAWIEKLGQRKSSGAGNAKRWGVPFDSSAIEESIGIAVQMLAGLNPQSRALRNRPTKGMPSVSQPNPVGTPDPIPSGSQETETGIVDISLRSISDLSETSLSDASELPKAQSAEEPKPKAKRRSYPEDFERFWRGYPTDANMSKIEAHDVWKRLDTEDRQAALASLPGFNTYCRQNLTYRPVHANRYLAKRRFEGHIRASPHVDVPKGNTMPDEWWRDMVRTWKSHRSWPIRQLSEPPDSPATSVPPRILAEFNIHPAQAA